MEGSQRSVKHQLKPTGVMRPVERPVSDVTCTQSLTDGDVEAVDAESGTATLSEAMLLGVCLHRSGSSQSALSVGEYFCPQFMKYKKQKNKINTQKKNQSADCTWCSVLAENSDSGHLFRHRPSSPLPPPHPDFIFLPLSLDVSSHLNKLISTYGS